MQVDCRDVRAAAWKAMWRDGWVWRAFFALAFSSAFALAFHFAWGALVVKFNVVTWENFNIAKMQALASGIEYSVPSRKAATMMTLASLLQAFFNHLVSGVCSLVFVSVSLRAVAGRREGWLRSISEAFSAPFSAAMLSIRQYLQVLFWTFLLIVPGIVAAYRYSQAWFLKCDNPDWSAGRCLKESAAMMDGRKMALFRLDMSYFWPVTLVFAVVVALVSARSAGALATPVFASAAAAAALIFSSVVVYIYFGHAEFYRRISEGDKECTPTSPM
jgi:uncharacterized membrane protein